jgi:type II secretory pathway component PulK
MSPLLASRPRKGLALVIALTILAAVSAILSVATVQMVAQHETLRRRHAGLQAEWLARAGVELAAARLLDKPAAFTEENRELVADAKVRVVVEKSGADTYVVQSEAVVGLQEPMPAVQTATARFRRSERDGAARLERLPPEPAREPRKDD